MGIFNKKQEEEKTEVKENDIYELNPPSITTWGFYYLQIPCLHIEGWEEKMIENVKADLVSKFNIDLSKYKVEGRLETNNNSNSYYLINATKIINTTVFKNGDNIQIPEWVTLHSCININDNQIYIQKNGNEVFYIDWKEVLYIK